MKALVVDDDLALADVISFTLRRAGFEVVVAHDGLIALEKFTAESPDIIILDLNLPKLDGFGVCKQIRAQADTPIIILSVRGDEDDIVTGLSSCADDYIVKPFSPRQLVARAQAVLRRTGAAPQKQAIVQVAAFSLIPSRLEVYYRDELVTRLTKLEAQLLETLMINRDQVMPYDALIDRVWGPGGGDRAMLKQLVYRLRKKLTDKHPDLDNLDTVSGVGYTFNSKH